MADQKDRRDQKEKQTQAYIYGLQGNEGQYGQGQYDSEGKPDPRGAQARRAFPNDQTSGSQRPKPGAHQRKYEDYRGEIPLD